MGTICLLTNGDTPPGQDCWNGCGRVINHRGIGDARGEDSVRSRPSIPPEDTHSPLSSFLMLTDSRNQLHCPLCNPLYLFIGEDALFEIYLETWSLVVY